MVSALLTATHVVAEESEIFTADTSFYPTPLYHRSPKDVYQLNNSNTIFFDHASTGIAALLQQELQATGISLDVKEIVGQPRHLKFIAICERSTIPRLTRFEPPIKKEEFHLSVTNEGVSIFGADRGGILYGVIAFFQLFEPDTLSIGKIQATSSPYMSFRGLRGHFPRNDPKEINQFKRIVRAMAFCRLNQLWIRDLYVRRFPASVQWDSHPEISDEGALPKSVVKELVQYAEKYNVKVMGSLAATADNVWSMYPELIEMHPGESPFTVRVKAEREKGRTEKYRFGSRFNFCPSREETYRLLFDLIGEMSPLFTSEVFDLGIDEVDQDYNGSRWVACELCSGKDPVKLFAEYVNRLAAHVLSKGKIPLVNSTPFIKEHGGGFHHIYSALPLLRKEVIINNWSEAHVRKAQKNWLGRPSKFRSTDYFGKYGFDDIVHLVGHERRWKDRPELLETKGMLDCYGAFVTHYRYMTDGDFKDSPTIDDMAFSSKHFWNPNQAQIGSEEDERQISHVKKVIKGILEGKPIIKAVAESRGSIEGYQN